MTIPECLPPNVYLCKSLGLTARGHQMPCGPPGTKGTRPIPPVSPSVSSAWRVVAPVPSVDKVLGVCPL